MTSYAIQFHPDSDKAKNNPADQLENQAPDIKCIREAYTLEFEVHELERKLDQLMQLKTK